MDATHVRGHRGYTDWRNEGGRERHPDSRWRPRTQHPGETGKAC